MNIEEAIDILTQKEIIDLSNHFNNTRFFEAIYTLLTAYENLKSYNRGTKEALRVAEDLEHQANKETGDWESRYFELEAELEKEKEKNKSLEQENSFLKMMYGGTDEFKAIEKLAKEE